jgi:signal transduction histidine kinase
VEVGSAVSGSGRSAFADEFVERVRGIVDGEARQRPVALPRLDACETRALALVEAGGASDEMRRSAAVEFLGDAVATLALDGAWEKGSAREAVSASAPVFDMSPGAALLAVFLRALTNSEVGQLPPQIATELFLWLLVELGPADAASLWAAGPSGRVRCLAAAGEAPKTRRFRAAAVAALDDRAGGSAQVHAVCVDRWDRPFAALAARVHPSHSTRLSVWLREAAVALSPVLERETLFERNATRVRELVSASERRLLRVGYDLHDGPLQEIVALAEDLRLMCSQVVPRLEADDASRVAGRFEDLEARVGALDRSLRDVALSIRPTSAVERPLEHVFRQELEALGRACGTETTLDVAGDTRDLTDSQKIVLYRVVQESLANVRKHSSATRADVRMRAMPGYVEVTISDNGSGFDIHSTVQRALHTDRMGLAGISERVRLLGGALDIEARIGEGVVVRATLPRWRPVEQAVETAYAAVI